MEEIKSLSIDLRKKEEKKKVIQPKVKSIRKEVDKWQFDDIFLELDKQWECLTAVKDGLTEFPKDVCREMRRQIQNKVSSYKMQDIQKQKYDDNKFVDLNFVIAENPCIFFTTS